MKKTQSKVNPEWEKLGPQADIHFAGPANLLTVGPRPLSESVQSLCERQTRRCFERAAVWLEVDEALNTFFPRSALQQRLLDKTAIFPAFSSPGVDLLPDKADAAARRFAFRQLLIRPKVIAD